MKTNAPKSIDAKALAAVRGGIIEGIDWGSFAAGTAYGSIATAAGAAAWSHVINRKL